MLAYKVTCGYDKFRHPYDGHLRVSTVCKSDVSDLKFCTEMKPAVSCVSTNAGRNKYFWHFMFFFYNFITHFWDPIITSTEV